MQISCTDKLFKSSLHKKKHYIISITCRHVFVIFRNVEMLNNPNPICKDICIGVGAFMEGGVKTDRKERGESIG